MVQNPSKNKIILRTLGIIEVVLAFVAIAIYFATVNATDFSGFAVLYPIIGMIVVGVIGFIVLITSGATTTYSQSLGGKIKAIAAIIVFGLPVYYLLSGFMGSRYSTVFIIFLLATAIYVFAGQRLGASSRWYKIILLAFSPLIGLMYFFDANNTAPYAWLGISIVIFVAGLAKIASSKN